MLLAIIPIKYAFRVNTGRDNFKHTKGQADKCQDSAINYLPLGQRLLDTGDCGRADIRSELCADLTPKCKVDQHY